MNSLPPLANAADSAPVDQFAAHVAHDFNNLLTGILGNLELLQMRVARQGVQGLDAYLNGARSAGNRATLFSQRLLLFSGRLNATPERLQVDELLRELTETMPDIQLALAAGDEAVLCARANFMQAVLELLENAVAAGGTVFLDSIREPGRIIIRVRDTGPGMTPEILARAAEPFFTTQSNGAGKGLGLPIALRCIQQEGGECTLDSEPGKGTTATITLPSA